MIFESPEPGVGSCINRKSTFLAAFGFQDHGILCFFHSSLTVRKQKSGFRRKSKLSVNVVRPDGRTLRLVARGETQKTRFPPYFQRTDPALTTTGSCYPIRYVPRLAFSPGMDQSRLTIIPSTLSNSSRSMGFERYSSMPAARNRSRSPFKAWAVRAMIGM